MVADDDIFMLPMEQIITIRQKAIHDVIAFVESVHDQAVRSALEAVQQAMMRGEAYVEMSANDLDLDHELVKELIMCLAAGRAGKLHMVTFGEEEAMEQITELMREQRDKRDAVDD